MIERRQPDRPLDPETARRREHYVEQEARLRVERDALRGRWNRVGNLRLVAFVLAAAFAFAALQTGNALVFVPAALALIAFVALVGRHRRLRRALDRAVALHAVNREAVLRNDRDWDELPLRHEIAAVPGHPFARDLDLFGKASLFHLLETVTTAMGADCLRRWLLEPALPAEVAARQGAVRDLAPEQAWRHELAVRGRLIGAERPDPEPLLDWAEAEPWLRRRPALRFLAVLGPILVVGAIVAGAFGWLPWIALTAALAFNVVLTQAFGGDARWRIGLVAEHERSVAQYAELLAQVEAMPGASPAAAAMRSRVAADGRTASALLEELGRRAAFAVPPGTMLYYPLQALLAWDLNVLAGLERWQASAGAHVREWLEAIGEAEALAALATLAYDNPTWAFPAVDPSADRIGARALGHPLLADAVRVANDVEVGPPGSFLFVTGSNMSGKSTLLRGIGVDLVLAGAGGPVCAAALSCPPTRLWTSVRVEDSLERGVSFFMAELQRLKQIVDAADEADPEGRQLVFLLDEILQGTNTAERQIAARRVIRHLVDSGAIGAVSTHDLTLAEGDELAGIARPVHLRDTVTAAGMAFDYRLRPGVATSTNALRLMEIVFGPEGVRGEGTRDGD